MTPTAHPRLPGDVWRVGEALADTDEKWPVTSSHGVYDDGFVRVRVDAVQSPDGEAFDRSVVEHRGAVGILALDDSNRVLLLRQYRHATGRRLLELPAGICDVDGESPTATASRELHEEASLRAADWRHLLDVVPTPGSSSERWLVYLARDLTPVPDGDRHTAVHEEADMTAVWVPLDAAVAAVLNRRLTDAMTGIAVLACSMLQSAAGLGSLERVDVSLPTACREPSH